jgi:hypothetical protein
VLSVSEAGDPGVGENAVGGPRLGVVADQDRGIERAIESLHLAPLALQLSAAQLHALDQIVRAHVAHVAVRVADHDLAGAAFDRASDHGVAVARHELAKGVEPGQPTKDFLEPLQSRGALHVDRDEQLHPPSPTPLTGVLDRQARKNRGDRQSSRIFLD